MFVYNRFNKAVNLRSQAISIQAEDLSQRLDKLKADHDKLRSLLDYAMKKLDEEERRGILETIGVRDGCFDLNAYVDSLQMQLNEVESVNTIIRKARKPNVGLDANELMGGIDFG